MAPHPADDSSASASTASRPLSLIVAIARNGVIGRRGGLPWSYPEDHAYFEATTRGHAVIMGRRTWEERGSPLPERFNVVVTREPRALADDAVGVARSFDEALELAWARDPSPFVIGGVRIFQAALPRVTRAYVTEIPETPDGDTVYRFDPAGFHLVSARPGHAPGLRFLVYER